jgi:hypothetical protein
MNKCERCWEALKYSNCESMLKICRIHAWVARERILTLITMRQFLTVHTLYGLCILVACCSGQFKAWHMCDYVIEW